ncbi:substrate-binding periplasmic protein [Shewanella sp. OMA3-2]|uniref:substrate-binding periplasmic protein n=1 Tax=Shewanella sp. OMA3-2 TaxID=2908650 RepID=UPI001F20E131|nr:transporter substrate-binding domain-containing protein [Shewanella sp. OMA3-2]UJF22604.1 transporter substrate-binding domain-containing protein [Shewanella sp. OMA3-2]
MAKISPIITEAYMLITVILRTAFILIICCFPVSAKTIHIASDVWCPYICDTQPGYLVEIVQRAFETQGEHVIFVPMPFNRALKEAQAGHIDAVLAVSKSIAIEQSLLTGETIVGEISNDFFTVHNNPWIYEKLSDLSSQSIAVIKGYDYGEVLASYLSNNQQVYWAVGDKPLSMNIIRMLRGRHQIIIGNRYVIQYTAKQLAVSDQIKYAGAMPEKINLYVAFNQDKLSKMHQFDLGVKTLKTTGEYQQILDKYQITSDYNQSTLNNNVQ